LGLFRPRPIPESAFDAASGHHYVLARRGRLLTAAGRDVAVQAGMYSSLLRRFLAPRDVGAINDHNFRRARQFFQPSLPLTAFAA
jgi:hypothetical protein